MVGLRTADGQVVVAEPAADLDDAAGVASAELGGERGAVATSLRSIQVQPIPGKGALNQGPVLAVIRCKDFSEWLRIANDTEFGLTGAVWAWFGTQGFEYLDLGRFWQVLLYERYCLLKL